MKKVFLALLTVLALGTLAACGGDPDPESISLDESSVEIDVGESVTVSATVEPDDADQDVEWSSDDTSVATVDEGEITGVADGSTTITATSTVDEDITASVEVTVEEEDDDPSDGGPESVSLSEEDLQLEEGDEFLIEATVEPEDAEQDVEWSSDDEDVAEIAGGVLDAIGPGEATITATSTEDDSVSASITVTVIEATSDIADVIAMDDGEDDIFVEGVVTAITNHATFFVEDSSGAMAIYDGSSSYDGPDGDYIGEVSVGDQVRISGERATYDGLQQLEPSSVEVLEEDVDLPDPVNLNEEDVDLSDEDALMAYQGHRVAFGENIVSNIDVDEYGTYDVDLVGFNQGYSIPFEYDNRLPIEDTDPLFTDLEETDVIDVESMVLGWSEGPQLLYSGEGDYAETDMGDESLDAYRVDTYLTAESPIPWAENVAADMDETFTFESLDTDVATVDSDGVITGEGTGATLVRVKDEAGDVFTSIFVVVHGLEVQVNDSLNDDGELLVRTDEEFELDYSVLPEDLISQDVTVESDDESVVSVDDSDGVTLTGESEGSATLTITSDNDPDASMELDVVVENSVPELDYIEEYQVYEGDDEIDEYDSAEDYILRDATASDYMDGDLTEAIEIVDDDYDGFDIDATGTYEIDIKVTNSFGEETEGTITIEVVEEGETIDASGTYNFKYVDSDTRHTLFAAAERYLLETVYGGVPSTIDSGYALYSERTQLPVEDPVPVLDYGTVYGDFSDDDDDSTVRMDDGEYGEEGEKTWRGAETSDPGQYNQWEYEDSISADFLDLMLDSLYYFDFNEDETGYEVLPSMANDMPIPDEDEKYTNEYGVELSKEWRVPINPDLEWYYHEDTLENYDGFSNGDEITAEDFIDTYKLALDEEWFRAISGGGDFTTAPQEIKNAQAYADGEAEWDEVGLDYDGDELVFEFEEDIDEWNIIYWLSSFVTTPINLDLYDEVGDSYGTTPETTAFHGPYYLDQYDPDKILRFEENPEFHDDERYNFTGHTYQIIEDDSIRFQEFLNGNLDSVAVPGSQYESYQNDPRIKEIPGATTFRANINSLGTVEAQQEQFEGSDFVPEPLLAWENDDGDTSFRNALYHAWDRETIAEDVQVTNLPSMYYFSEAYLVAPQEGVSFREWDNLEANRQEYIDTLDSEDDFDQDEFDDWLEDNRDEDASIVGEGLGVDTLGYNPDLARAIFEDAMDDLVDDGVYELGTPDDPLEIELQFTIQSGSSSQTAYAEFMKDELEEIFDYQNEDGETLAYVTLDIDPVEFPENYSNRLQVGQTDIGMGGISGSTLDAAGFLDVFADDNRGQFTLDWGIDTSTANIEVTYEVDDTEVTELWSYNALVSALNGTTRVSDGEEVE